MGSGRLAALVDALAEIRGGFNYKKRGYGHRKTTPSKARQVKVKMRAKGRH